MALRQPQQPWDQNDDISPITGSGFDLPPRPPVHRHPVGMHSSSQYNQMQAQRNYQSQNNYSDLSTPGVTPGTDNLGANAAGGGINGIARGVADANERDSGMQAARAMSSRGQSSRGHSSNGVGPRPLGVPDRSPNGTPFDNQYAYEPPTQPRSMYPQRPNSSRNHLAAGGAGPAGMYSSNSSLHSQSSPHNMPYSDTPYNRFSSSAQNLAPQMGAIDPNDIDEADDWGMDPNSTQAKRRSFVPFGGSRDGSRNGSPGSSIIGGAGAPAVGAAAGTAAFAASRDGSGKYGAVPAVNASQELIHEKSEFAKKADLRKRKKRMWIAIAIIIILVAGAILGGVLGALLNKSGGKDGKSQGPSASDVAADNKDDLDKNSSEIKALMKNPNLHKVFPGMDYTPLNAQYPECLTVPPSQNNITRDMAVMSQLTPAVRLYGTDCNQTQMLIHAIDRLDIKSSMKLWLGVWLDKNDTTTQRQIDQTWKILDDYGCDYFKGIIIGNEVLFREDLTATQLLTHITAFRKNITDHKCQLPVAMADLGDNWTAEMATKVDYVMSNVHPFFAGVDVKVAASWTWNFWQTHDVVLTSGNTNIKQVVAEVGWPSAGGKSCGSSPTCTSSTPGSVAGIDEMNQFMQDWVCPSMKNGTEYFWFSAFDEPWKIRYNEKGKEWEDKWGLMDINRNLKPGVKIPTCDGLSLPS